MSESKQQFRPHEAAAIKSGKHAGMVGTVIETRPETGMVKVHIEGIRDGQAINVETWLKAEKLEHHA